jgi:chromosomal replication initiation ATPase DnaA
MKKETEKIIKTVCNYYQISEYDFLNKSKKGREKEVSEAKVMAGWLAIRRTELQGDDMHKDLGMTLKTAQTYHSKIQKKKKEDPKLREQIRDIIYSFNRI